MKYIGSFFILLAIALFWFLFFVVAPYVASTIPAGEWQPFIRVACTGLIAWFGGIAVPFILIVIGIGAIIQDM